jgi:DNA invertase Pin-like site-specific DNA recombinase
MAPEEPRSPKKPFLVGYARVSTDDQDNARQVEELTRHGAQDIFRDTASGRNMDRPGWSALWRDIREGDVVLVLTLDRLGRDVLQILQTVEAMKARGVELRVINGGFDTTTPVGRFTFNIMAAMAQFERELILERTLHGLQKARERGVIGGRPVIITAEIVADCLARQAKGESVRAIADGHKVSHGGLKKAMDRYHKRKRMEDNEHEPR